MTQEEREQAARVLESMRFDYIFNKNIDAIDTAIAVLREPVLDENGLVPCGCGGKAEIVRTIEYWDWIAQNKVEVKKVQCDKCYVSTPGSVTNEYAMQKWNTAMSGGACSHET